MSGAGGGFVRVRVLGEPQGTLAQSRAPGALQAKPTSAPQKQSKLSPGCSGSCCHGDTKGSSESIGGTCLPSAWSEAGGGDGGTARTLSGTAPQTYATWPPLALEFTDLG